MNLGDALSATTVRVTHHLPLTHVGDWVYPPHPLAGWICDKFGVSGWTRIPMMCQDAVMVGGTLYVSPAQLDAIQRTLKQEKLCDQSRMSRLWN